MAEHIEPPSAGRAGRMTAVMRAMPGESGPRLIRIGLVQGGKVVEERLMKQRADVTIGRSEKNTFVVPGHDLPPSFRLFEIAGGAYVLRWVDSMTGRVALDTGTSDLAALRARAERVATGDAPVYEVRLGDQARGKVTIGETTFLFQLVASPPVAAKPQLPVSVRRGLADGIDWATTIIAAFSFLFHFGAVGSIYADWMDGVIDDDVEIQPLVESVKQLPSLPVEQPKDAADTPVNAQASAGEAKPSGAARGGRAPGAGAGAGSGGKMNDARASQIAGDLARLDMQMIGALSANGGSSTGVVTNGADVPLALLEGAAASAAGAAAGDVAGLHLGGGNGGVVRPGAAGGGGLAAIGNTAGGAPATAGSAVAVRRPTGNVVVQTIPSAGVVPGADATVAGMGAGFRRCYTRGLNEEDPNMKGSVRISAKIGPNGDVLSAIPSGGGGLSATVVSCIASRVAGAQFSPPPGGGAILVIPVKLVPQ